ncbi:MAG: hydratase [Alsobacter sp.]
MDETRARAASDLLVGHWDAGTRIDALPEQLRPSTRAEGYAIQAQVERRSASSLFGWKIAATSQAGQRHINVDGPLAGRILAEKVREPGATIPLSGTLMRVAEIEFAFRFGRDLPPRPTPYGVAEVLEAVASLHPAIEIPDSRYTDFCAVGAAQLIADDACAHLFMLGPASDAPWRQADLAAAPVSATLNGEETRHGKGANALGDPRVALAWIVNELSGLGLTMQAGQVVTTGTCVVPVEVAPGDEVRGDWGPYGTLSVRFA